MPECKGVDHKGLCHKCPHRGDVRLASMAWEETPCAGCQMGESLAQGHGRGRSLETVPPRLLAQLEAQWTEEEDPRRDAVDAMRTALRAFCALGPKELVTVVWRAQGLTLREIRRLTKAYFHEDITEAGVSLRAISAEKRLARAVELM